MNLFTTFKTSSEMESKGIWIEYGQTESGAPIRIRIARSGGANMAWAKARDKAMKPHRKALSSGHLDLAFIEKILRTAFAESVVLGFQNVEPPEGDESWKPFLDEKGHIVYSPESATKLLNDLPDLYKDLEAQASDMALFQEESRSSDLGNSGASLNTASTKDP